MKGIIHFEHPDYPTEVYCSTQTNWGPPVTTDWGAVTCKRCLAMRAREA